MLMPFFCPASGVVFSSLTFVDSTTGSSSTIVVPATAQAGDVGLLFQRAADSGTGSVTPSGWTTITDGVGGAQSTRCMVSFKILTSGDPGATLTGMNSGFNTKAIAIFRPNSSISGYELGPTTPSGDTGNLTTGDYTQSITNGNPPAMTCTASNSGNPVTLVIGASASNAGTCAPTNSLVSAGTNYATSVRQAAYVAIQTGHGSDLIYDEVDTGTATVAQTIWIGFF